MPSGRLGKRLEALEAHSAPGAREYEDSVLREVLRRMTDAELDHYVAALKRRRRGDEATSEDLAIAARAGVIREEVEHAQFGA